MSAASVETSALRYLAGHVLDRRVHRGAHCRSMLGSALLGGLLGAAVNAHPMALLGTRPRGALTTCSAVSAQSVLGAHAGPRRGTAYAVVTVDGFLAAATLGHLLVHALS